jgi:hypothetical protein
MSTTRQLDLVSVESGVETAGAIVWWRLEGGIRYDTLVGELHEAGLPDELLPAAVSPKTALRRALDEMVTGRSFRRGVPGEKGAYVVVDERGTDRESLAYDVHQSARLVDGKLRIEGDYTFEQALRAAYAVELAGFTSIDLSEWLIYTLLPRLDAVSLRDGGGVYFIPHDHVHTFRRYVGAIQGESRFFEVPALKSKEAVAAILDAVTREVTSEADWMFGEIASGELGPRALDTRLAGCSRMLTKIKSYENLLGARLPNITEQVQKLQASITAATLVAQATAAEQAA